MSLATLLVYGLALAVATTIGYLLVEMLLPQGLRSLSPVLAAAVGLGVCSLVAFVFRRPMRTVEFVLLAGLFVVRFALGNRSKKGVVYWKPSEFVLILVLAATGLIALYSMLVRVDLTPDGGWDGWAIWNSHARILYFGGPRWASYLDHTFHGDYPLLTPLLTARLWRYAGDVSPEAGALIGLTLALSTCALLAAALWRLRGGLTATVMTCVLLGTPLYLEHATSQYADVPLSFFILGTIALLCLHFEVEPESDGLLILAGFLAGCAAWTKNEGILFLAIVCGLLLLMNLRSLKKAVRRYLPFALGLAPPLAVIIWFKVGIAPQTDLIQDRQYQETIQKLLDFSRYQQISSWLLQRSWSFGNWKVQPLVPVVAFVGLTGIRRNFFKTPGWRFGAFSLALLISGYFAVYVLTPLDLHYHLDSSADRLLLQLWPSFLFVVALAGCGKMGNGDSRGNFGDAPLNSLKQNLGCVPELRN